MLAINLDAPVLLVSRAERGMTRRGYGRIVNITSLHGRFGEEAALSYDVAKGGLQHGKLPIRRYARPRSPSTLRGSRASGTRTSPGRC